MTPFSPSRTTALEKALFLLAGLILACAGKPPVPSTTGENRPMTATSRNVDTPSPQRPNPLLQPFDTPFRVPPFDRIADTDYLPALTAAMAEHAAEVDRIAGNPDPPTFANTVAALDFAGLLLTRVSLVFFAKQSADTNEAVQAIAREAAPLLSAHTDRIRMNPLLFARVNALWDARSTLSLTDDEQRLLELTRRDFVRGGALLDDHQKQRLMASSRSANWTSSTASRSLMAMSRCF